MHSCKKCYKNVDPGLSVFEKMICGKLFSNMLWWEKRYYVMIISDQ